MGVNHNADSTFSEIHLGAYVEEPLLRRRCDIHIGGYIVPIFIRFEETGNYDKCC